MPKSVSNTSSTDKTSRYSKMNGSSGGGPFDLAHVDPVLLASMLRSVIQEGDAVLLGLTRDQGALCLQLLSSDCSDKFYDATPEAFEDRCRAILEVLGVN
jgi:hypothetical protein